MKTLFTQFAVLPVAYVTIALLTTGFLSGCIGGTPAAPLTAESAPTVLGNLAQVLAKLPQSNATPTLPMTGVSTASVGGVNAMAATNCETVITNPIVDADGDGIALLKESSFDCTNQVVVDESYTRKGTYKITDLDDTVAGMIGGMRADFGISSYDSKDLNTGAVSGGSYSGFWIYQKVDSTITSNSNFTGRHKYYAPTFNYDTDYTYTYTWEWTLTPTNINSAWTTGATSFTGTYALDGKFTREDHSGAKTNNVGAYSVKYWSKDLTYDNACAKWYKTGSYFVDDNNGNVMEIRYACTTAKLFVNGVESTWWTP